MVFESLNTLLSLLLIVFLMINIDIRKVSNFKNYKTISLLYLIQKLALILILMQIAILIFKGMQNAR